MTIQRRSGSRWNAARGYVSACSLAGVRPPAVNNKVPLVFKPLVKQSALDTSRPSIEFYRSRGVVDLLLPVR